MFVWLRSPRVNSLQRRVAELEDIIEQSSQDYFKMFENHLSILINDKLKLRDTERVSVYKYEEDSFVMLGRYSKNPKYCEKGRGKYPASEGCIAKAWRCGKAFVDDLPDPDDDNDAYLTALKNNWNINKATARGFKMKSRCYYGFAIENADHQRIAVVVVESVNASGLSKGELESAFSNGESKFIRNFLERMRSLEPSVSLARSEGY
jgi:hypothetical protein